MMGYKDTASRLQAIQVNLQKFGLPDMHVVGKLFLSDEEPEPELIFRRKTLSQLCAESAGQFELVSKMSVALRELSPKIVVERGGHVIGFIDDESQFFYTRAKDLRTAFGWAIATTFGGEVEIVDWDVSNELDRLCKLMDQAIETPSGYMSQFIVDELRRISTPPIITMDDFAELFWEVYTRSLTGKAMPFPVKY